ncbi:MAG: family 20 glycosylhydrolase [Bacteroidales bacterium]|nr:family 20 glycosylhydrolase [Bacteroidales bacterium]
MKKRFIGAVAVVVVIVAIVISVFYKKYIKPSPPITPADRAAVHIMPLPAKIKLTGRTLFLSSGFDYRIKCKDHSALIGKALQRFTERIEKLVPPVKGRTQKIPLEIFYNRRQTDSISSKETESYDLIIKSRKIILRAGGYQGVLHGLETILQLVNYGMDKPGISTAVIHDQPRFSWRGLMIDVCRHWIPKDVILRNIDAMAAVKMNVLHLHLTDYQAFRIESKVFPLLQEKGSGGNYFTQEDIREIIRYAADRGIRVVPEFDLPGHCTSWFAGYPELATLPGRYVPDTTFGVLYPVMDPTREEVYRFLDRFFGEMASLFPDPYIHIGGDEVNPKQWNESKHVQQFMQNHNLTDAHALQAYFNNRLEAILKQHGKKMMGWDEILNPSLPKDIIVQSWRNHKSLFDAVGRGGHAILSAGYYLDHKLPAWKYYSVDPEIIPGAVDIKPDTLHWKTYAITMDISGNRVDGSLTLYGLTENLRGFVTMMGGRIAFPEAEVKDNQLIFSIQTDYGKVSFRLLQTDDSIAGKGSLGVVGIHVYGKLTGSNELAGTLPPVFEQIKPLTKQEKKRVLGGEACMWSELVDSITIESRIWPRTVAIAEKLWSPAALTKDTEDMYRRLKVTDHYLILMGLQHHAHYLRQLHALAGDADISTLKSFVDLLEEVKYYDRMSIYQHFTVHTPLNRVVDAAWPESLPARSFNRLVQQYIDHPDDPALRDSLGAVLESWAHFKTTLLPYAENSPRVNEVMPLADLLSDMSETSLQLIKRYSGKQNIMNLAKHLDTTSTEAVKPVDGVLLAVDQGFRKLAGFFKYSKSGNK